MDLSDKTLLNASLSQLHQALFQGDFSAMELTDAYLARCQQFNPDLNALITLVESEAKAQAQTVDNQIRQGDLNHPLAGIPYVLKDLFCSKGVRTTCGSNMLSKFISPYDATVAAKLKAAGSILIGKANMDEFGMGSSNENSAYGSVKNPWDQSRVPGGSSGGSAAAMSARLAPFTLGSDTGGSIRQPASLTGITGLKPTYGRVSRWGMTAFASSLDQAGPMVASAEDAALVLEAIAGFDQRDSTSMDKPVPQYSANLNDSIDGVTVGIPAEFFTDDLDANIAALIDAALAQFKQMGVKVKPVSLPNSHLALAAYYVIAPAEASSNLSRFDGVRYGHRCDAPDDLLDLYQRSRWEGFGDEVKRRIMVGAYALSAGYYDAYYLKAQKIRRLIQQDFVAAFNDVDMILSPVAPSTAFKIGEKTSDPVSMYMGDLFTIPVSLAGLPGMSFPIGFSENLPVGLQVVGNYFAEAKMLNFVHQYQQQSDWHQRVPAQFGGV